MLDYENLVDELLGIQYRRVKNKSNDLVRGLKVIEMPADGSCLFHSIGYFLYPPRSIKKLRQLLVEHVRKNLTTE